MNETIKGLRDTDPCCNVGMAAPSITPSEMLMRRAEQLRTQAHELETLARSLPEHNMSVTSMNTLGNLISAGLYR